MKIEYIKKITLNSILYVVMLFLVIWNNLQIEKPTIPFNTVIFYFCIFCLLVKKRKRINYSKDNSIAYLIKILCVGFLLLLFKTQYDANYTSQIWSFFPIFLVAICLEKASKNELLLSKFLFLSFIVLNCCLLFYERKTMTVLLWNSEDYSMGRNDISDLTMFRASGLTGHPVLGGFLLSIELAFIQLSKMKQNGKYIFTCLIFLGLLCINSRANIVLSALVSLYLFKDALFSQKNRFFKVGFIFLICIFFYNLVTTTDYGGRLMFHESGVEDSSTMARIEILSFFKYVNWSQILWGDLGLTDYLMSVMGLAGIENGYIVLILKYGLVFGGGLIWLLIRYQFSCLNVYSKDGKYILFFLFIILASTNPHIAHAVPWIFWITSYYLFRPSLVKYNKES